MKNKKKVKIVIIVAILIIFMSLGVYGYFIYKKSVTNNMVLGYNDIEVNEKYQPPLKIEKGTSFQKEPTVTNNGNVDCYVRIKSLVSDSRVGEYLSINYDEVNYNYNKDDGYYYYKKVLKPGETTEPLFTTVEISKEASDDVLNGFEIYVYAESVQTVEGMNMEEVWNYFNKAE